MRSSLLMALLLAGCTAPNSGDAADPARREVTLPSPSSWNASLVLDQQPTGIWTVKPMQVFEQYACPEVVALDDLGRCHVLVSYSGKWTPVTTLSDGTWLGGLCQGDVAPEVPGPELYTGGKRGNLYQVVAHREGVLSSRRIAYLPGLEIHTLIATDLDRSRPGDELIAFTRPGGLYRLTPPADGLGEFDVELVEELDGRIRDAVVLPTAAGSVPELATLSRAGRLALLRWEATGPRWETVFERAMGMGRLCLAPGSTAERLLLYSTCDDGTVWRHERVDGSWSSELIYAGPQGPRGIAVGRFHEDPDVESVAVFGYSARVELLTRGPAGWELETLFVDRDKGHWLSVAELDGRNGTDELVLSGYGARVVLLARPPGYALPGVLTETPDEPDAASPEPGSSEPEPGSSDPEPSASEPEPSAGAPAP